MAKGDTSTGPGVSNVWSGDDAIGSIGVMVVCNAVSQRAASVRARKTRLPSLVRQRQARLEAHR